MTDETFFRSYINFKSLKDKSKAPVWLCQIAKNTYFSWYNEQMKSDKIEESVLEDQSNLQENYEYKELANIALNCLNDLEDPYKGVFKLSAISGVSLKEISRIYNKAKVGLELHFTVLNKNNWKE